MDKEINPKWWSDDYGFFGKFYMDGDDSLEGFLAKEKQGLQKRTETEVDGVVKLLNLEKGQSVLDVPCGYGRHSIELAKRGYQVSGYDINKTHLEIAKERAAQQEATVEFKEQNMITIKDDQKFDAVINMFYSFGFFEKDEENMEALKRFYRALKPGGKFLMHTDVNIPLILKGRYKEDETRSLKSGGRLQIVDRYDSKKKRINGTWIITRPDGGKEQKSYSVRVYEKEEFAKLCLEVGFQGCEVFSDWAGAPYDEDGEEIMFVAHKK